MQKKHSHKNTQSRANRPTFFVVLLGWLLGLLVLVGVAIFLSFHNYQEITRLIAQMSGKTDRLDVLRNQYLTPLLFWGLRILAWLLSLGVLLAYRWITRLEEYLIQTLGLCTQLVLVPCQNLQQLSKRQKLILAVTSLLIALSRIYYYWLFPLQYDEAFTYIHLVSKCVLVSVTYYPGPNNHVFFSEIASVLDWVVPSILSLRLPSILSSLLLWFLLWDWFATKLRFEWALLLASLILFTPTLSVYSVMGRGYGLQLICVVVGFRVILSKEFLLLHRFAFVLSSVVGFYLVPTYLYVFVPLVVFKSSQLKRTQVKQWLFDFTSILLITSTLYTPIILINGLGAITNNGWVQSLGLEQWFKQLLPYLTTLTQAIWGDEAGLGIGISFVLLMILYTFYRPKKYFVLMTLLLPFLMILGQSVLPPARVFQYLVLLFGWLLVEVLSIKPLKVKTTYAITITLAASLFFYGFTTTKVFQVIAQTPHPHIQIAQTITSQKTPQKIWVNHDTYAVFLKYYQMEGGVNHQVDTQRKEGVKYDWVILTRNVTPPASYLLYSKNKAVVIYRRPKK